MKFSFKREFPVLNARASTYIATPLIGIVAIFYVVNALNRPAAEIYGVGIAAFGVTAGLAAVCFSVPESINGSPNFRYAAEKFLHSSVLLIQTVMLVYLKDWSASSEWLNNHFWVGRFARLVPGALLSLLAGFAAITWHQGFDVIDWQLWQNWNRRIDEINKPATNEKGCGPADKKEKSKNA